jgi:hypothetical protein
LNSGPSQVHTAAEPMNWKRISRRLSLLQVGIWVLITTSLIAQKETFVPANDVSFTISPERTSYRAGEQISFKYRVTNVSNGKLYVPREWEATCPASPHVWAWLENSSGQHFVPGYAGSCSSSTGPKTVIERMHLEAVLLRPGEHLDGTFRLDTTIFGHLKPGVYRIEAILYGWRDEKFTDAERSDLARMAIPFLRGEIPVSVRITLKP